MITIDVSWQPFELMDKEAEVDDQGKPVLDENEQPVFKDIPTGISMEVKPMDYQATQAVMILFKDFKQDEDIKTQALKNNPVMKPEIINVICSVLPTHVRNLKGVQIKDGETVRDATVEDILNHGQMFMYSVSILLKIFSISNLKAKEKEEIKKFLAE